MVLDLLLTEHEQLLILVLLLTLPLFEVLAHLFVRRQFQLIYRISDLGQELLANFKRLNFFFYSFQIVHAVVVNLNRFVLDT